MSNNVYLCLIKVSQVDCREGTLRTVFVAKQNETKESPEPDVLTFQEAQQFLRVSHQTIYRLIEKGLPSHKVGRKRVFLKEELLQWVKRQ